MTIEHLGIIALIVGFGFGAFQLVRFAVIGYKRTERLVELGQQKEREDMIAANQRKLVGL